MIPLLVDTVSPMRSKISVWFLPTVELSPVSYFKIKKWLGLT